MSTFRWRKRDSGAIKEGVQLSDEIPTQRAGEALDLEAVMHFSLSNHTFGISCDSPCLRAFFRLYYGPSLITCDLPYSASDFLPSDASSLFSTTSELRMSGHPWTLSLVIFVYSTQT